MNILSRQPWRRAVAIGVLTVAAGAGTVAVAAPSGGMGRHGAAESMMPLSSRGIDRMLDSVNATPEQRAQIQQIGAAARADLKAQHETGRALREQAMLLFTQPTVDANAAEALRLQMLGQHDRASQRIMQAMLEVSRVLSPEQRQQLAERMKQHGERMQRHPMKERAAAAPKAA